MMQFNETPPQPFQHQITSFTPNATTTTTTIMNKNHMITPRRRPGFPTSKALGNFGDANCIEQLLVHCANAIESNDATLAQQILWVLNNTAQPDGDSNQRLACAFLRALIARATKFGTCKVLMANVHCNQLSVETHKFSLIELASFIDLTPWHRFGFTAANAAILDAVEGYSVIHIVDLGSTHCMQIPTLIDAIANRLEGRPLVLKLTVTGPIEGVPPMIDYSYEELKFRLVTFARSRNITMDFRLISSNFTDGFCSLIEQLRMQQHLETNSTTACEALVINCHMMLHYISEEALPSISSAITCTTSLRSMFLKAIRSLEPTIVVIVDEDADLTSNNLVCRLRSAFNYLWIPYDTVDSVLPKGSKQRQWFEEEICRKIENVIAYEGLQRVERLELKSQLVQRMRNAGFRGIGFGEDAVSEVKAMLDEHAAGWGLKKEEDDVVLTWKGHNVVFATAWVPI